MARQARHLVNTLGLDPLAKVRGRMETVDHAPQPPDARGDDQMNMEPWAWL